MDNEGDAMSADDTQQGKDQESALIGAVLRRPALFDDLRETIAPDNFGWSCYGEIWQAMNRLRDNGLSVDTLTIGDELERMGKLATCQPHLNAYGWSGRVTLSQLREIGEPIHAKTYAENVLDYSAKWRMAQLFREGYGWAVNGRRAGDIMADINRKLGDIRTIEGRAGASTQTLAEAVKDAYEDTTRASQGESDYVQTGYIDIDRVIGGLSAPDFLIIAARPGGGKTALLSSIVKNIYDNQPQKRVLVLSLEMSNKQIAKRLLAMESGVSFDRQKSGKLTDDEWSAYHAAVEKLEYKNVFLNDLAAITPNRIRQELRRLGNIDLMILDYIQLAGIDGKERVETRALEVGMISRGLKQIAKDFNIPVLAAAQLSRAIEQRADKDPQLSDLRESGSLEQDSDVVMFLSREEKDKIPTNVTRVKIAKHRNGPVGTIDLVYKPALTRFENHIR